MVEGANLRGALRYMLQALQTQGLPKMTGFAVKALLVCKAQLASMPPYLQHLLQVRTCATMVFREAAGLRRPVLVSDNVDCKHCIECRQDSDLGFLALSRFEACHCCHTGNKRVSAAGG